MFNASLLWLEHRYWGESWPDRASTGYGKRFLTVEQALGDFAELIFELKQNTSDSGAVITFGGSYAGMLAAWMRVRYPHLVDGAISSSAPLNL